jgi:hypothetical protein
MKWFRDAKRWALAVTLALVANASVAGWHAVAAMPQSGGDRSAFAGQTVVICANGVLKTVRLGADGRPLQHDDIAQRDAFCRICQSYEKQTADLPLVMEALPIACPPAALASPARDQFTSAKTTTRYTIRAPPAAA